MRKSWIALFLLSLVVSLSAQRVSNRMGIAAPAGFDYKPASVKILSWNVEHFVDGHDNPYISNSREDRPGQQMQGKEELLAKAIRKVDADVVVLQEFESVAYLSDIANRLFPEMGYRFFAHAESYSWYMNVVVMSKVPLGTLYSYGSLYTPVPGVQNEEGQEETQINLNTRMWSLDILPNEKYSFTLTGVHLKAGRGERNEQMRLGQINFLKGQFKRFLKENKRANLVMLGDFNCIPGSNEFQAVLTGKKGNAFLDPLADTNILTHPSREPVRRLDHILPNVNMAKEMVPASVKVEYVLTKEEMVQLSDHLPVMAEFYTVDK